MLYPKLLQHSFENLPRALRDFHSMPGGGTASGNVDVRRENRWLAGLFGFPRSGTGIPLRLQVIATDDREVWIRRFGDGVFQSLQLKEGELLVEKVGPVRVYFRILADRAGLRFKSERARLWIIPVPVHIEAQAWGTETSWEFEVNVSHVGSYRGTVVPTV